MAAAWARAASTRCAKPACIRTCFLLNKPEFLSNAFSPAFNADGDLVDEGLVKQVAALMQALADWTRFLKNA